MEQKISYLSPETEDMVIESESCILSGNDIGKSIPGTYEWDE